MKSYTRLRDDYGRATNDTSSTNLTDGTGWMNDEIRRVTSLGDFPFMHKDRVFDTVADQQEYPLPYDIESVSTVKVVVGDTTYSPAPVNSQRRWDVLNYQSYTSDTPERYFVKNGEVKLWPTPSSGGNEVTINGKLRLRDLNTEDITGQTITTLTNGSADITLDGGLTDKMVGFWIRPTFSTTDNTGDGHWYEIAGIDNSTTGTLDRKYGGVSISGGTAACTISQVPILPESVHDLPVYYAAEQYWALAGNAQKSTFFGNKAKEKVAEFLANYKTNINDPVIDGGLDDEDEMIMNPNLFPSGLNE